MNSISVKKWIMLTAAGEATGCSCRGLGAVVSTGKQFGGPDMLDMSDTSSLSSPIPSRLNSSLLELS